MENLAESPSAKLVRAELEAELQRLKRLYEVPGS
jgi:hypothetical protein